MNKNRNLLHLFFFWALLLVIFPELTAQPANSARDEQYRPRVHFSPAKNWMNDPNGMVFYKGIYHLFYQYHPSSSVWGPMHWGHATSKDLIHWKHEPIALYPDSLGMIFSGSAIVDRYNTSGFAKKGNMPLVAVFTHHSEEEKLRGRNDFQNQSLAYSLDEGKTWLKYKGNPVLRSPGIPDFRDPKLTWHELTKKWIMTLAVVDRVHFYSSPDLKNWTKETEFGTDAGAHGGVWECPDLFSMKREGREIWVLLVSLNPGGPNKGSATQYFLGDFDGKKFKPFHTDVRWIDYGPDNYAGVTWSNTGERKLFLGWMSNWLYAQEVPTETWRSAMTIPRELRLEKNKGQFYLASKPVKEIASIRANSVVHQNISLDKPFALGGVKEGIKPAFNLNISLADAKDITIILSNEAGEQLQIGYSKDQDHFFLDRSISGMIDFNKEFAGRALAPRLSRNTNLELSLLVDASSVELFADNGLTVLTALYFSRNPYTRVSIQSPGTTIMKRLEYTPLKSIW